LMPKRSVTMQPQPAAPHHRQAPGTQTLLPFRIEETQEAENHMTDGKQRPVGIEFIT